MVFQACPTGRGPRVTMKSLTVSLISGGGKWIDGRSSDPSWRSTPAAVSCGIARRFFRLILKTATTAARPVSHSLEKRQHGKGHR